MIRGLGPGPRAYIESLQPYPQRGGKTNYALAVLHDLWNEDKHRLIRAWGFGVEHVHPHVAKRCSSQDEVADGSVVQPQSHFTSTTQ